MPPIPADFPFFYRETHEIRETEQFQPAAKLANMIG